jgi:hypothetical protein
MEHPCGEIKIGRSRNKALSFLVMLYYYNIAIPVFIAPLSHARRLAL